MSKMFTIYLFFHILTKIITRLENISTRVE